MSEEKYNIETELLHKEELKNETEPIHMQNATDLIAMNVTDEYHKLPEYGALDESEENVELVLVFPKKSKSTDFIVSENKLLNANSDDMLHYLKTNNVKCKIIEISKYICVVISIDQKSKAKAYLNKNNIFVHTDPVEFVKMGRQFNGFTPAHRTYIQSVDGPRDHGFSTYQIDGKPQSKMDIDHWNSVYMPYYSEIDDDLSQYNIYSKPIISHKITKQLLKATLDKAVDLPKYDVFVLDNADPNRHQNSSNRYLGHNASKQDIRSFMRDVKCSKCLRMHESMIDDLANYYGTSIGFYFSFFRTYNNMLIIMSIMGLICFLCQIFQNKIALKGLTVFMIISVLFVSLVQQNGWRKREQKHMVKWGIRHNLLLRESENNKTINIGSLALATVICCICSIAAIIINVYIIEEMYNTLTISLSAMVIMVAILIGFLIFVMNYIYLRISQYLPCTIYHKIIFTFVNSFCSLYYLAFFYKHNHEKWLFMVQIHIICAFITICALRNLWKFLQICYKNKKNTEEIQKIDTIFHELSLVSANFSFTENMLYKIVICYGYMIIFI
eukprot:464389_1